MPNQSYIEAHELYRAYIAVSLSGAGLAELQTFHDFDVDPLSDDLEADVIAEIINQCTSDFAGNAYKRSREFA